MSIRAAITGVLQHEGLNFVLTNRIPRRSLSIFMGWFSRIEQPLVRDLSIAAWRFFSDLDLSEARKTQFRSMHDCFIRELKPGARPTDPDPAVAGSPCDGIVGASGTIGDELLQAKDQRYSLAELVVDTDLATRLRGGTYVTLRICASMYHRFHAPHDLSTRRVTYVAGDAFNVNPVALARVPRLFCRNERAVIRTELLAGQHELVLVPVAAVLVASIRLHFADVVLHLRYSGPTEIPCDARLAKGEEMGWFQHGSTIIVLAPRGFSLAPGITRGRRIKAGQPLLHLPQP